jgi:hypothetical protein
MKTFLIAAVAVAISGAAFAKDLKGTVMTDSEMDKVTAGVEPTKTGQGIYTSDYARNILIETGLPLPGFPKSGVCTTAASAHC